MKKQNHEIFGVFQNLETRFKNISLQKKKKISWRNIFERDFFPDFGENTRFHFRHFHFPLGFDRNLFPPGKDFGKIWFTIWNFIFSLFKKHFFLQISFINSLEISTITIGSRVLNPLLRAASSPIVKPSILPFDSMYLFKRLVFSS